MDMMTCNGSDKEPLQWNERWRPPQRLPAAPHESETSDSNVYNCVSGPEMFDEAPVCKRWPAGRRRSMHPPQGPSFSSRPGPTCQVRRAFSKDQNLGQTCLFNIGPRNWGVEKEPGRGSYGRSKQRKQGGGPNPPVMIKSLTSQPPCPYGYLASSLKHTRETSPRVLFADHSSPDDESKQP